MCVMGGVVGDLTYFPHRGCVKTWKRNMSMTPSVCDFGLLEGQKKEIKPQAIVIRRNLFGPIDHQQLQQDFQRLFCMSVENAKQRWNFDFQREQPVPGCIEWEELQCQDVPSFYHSCVVSPGMAKQMVEVAIGGGSFTCLSATMVKDKYLELRTRGTFSRGTMPEKTMATLCGIKRKQSNITDFFRVTKRRFLHHKASPRQ